ncbi:hypothetical protein Bca4012_013153 [Brassica carinata]|uniref:Defensin n=1 Tax=Brassica carinata TaxID=52824 RepID=A0A8X7Q6Y2_BRACI|nr:hypothetical protein Bca52824_069273 [Brassica carinata]
MGRNMNSVSYTVLLLVLLAASTEIMKSVDACNTFLGECGPAPFLGTNADCFTCCKSRYGSLACGGVVEGTDQHCHCYQLP